MNGKIEFCLTKNPYPILCVAADGTILYTNEDGETFLQEWRVTVGERLPSYIPAIVQRAASQKIPEKLEVKIGDRVYLFVFSPISKEDCVIISGFDITSQKKLDKNVPKIQVALGDLEFAEFIDIQAIQSLMNDFYKLAHIPIGINDLKGNVLIGVGWQDICIKFHRIHPEACKSCVESDIMLTAGISPGEVKLYKCKNNMWDLASPVMVNDQLVGYIFSGQFFFEDEPLDYELFRSQARKYGFDETEYIEALEKVPRFSRETMDIGMSFFGKFANFLSQLSYSNSVLSKSLAERDTLLEALRESEEKSRNLIDTANEGIVITDCNNIVTYINKKMAEMLGYTVEEGIGRSLLDLIYEKDKPMVESYLERSPSGISDSYELRLKSKDGLILWTYLNAKPLFDEKGNFKGIISMLTDINKRKEAEENLIQEKIEAETANRAKSEFLATMSHELRTPLNSIIGFSDLMIGGNVGDLSPVQKKFLGNISTSGKHLLSLINNILDLSKIEASKMELNSELFAVKDLFTEVEQLISPLVEKKGLKVEFLRDEKLPTIYADKIRFKQILFNLASNAIKFTPAGGKITVSSKVKGEMAQFSVTDNGIGISAEDKKKLFKPFSQVDSSIERKYEGTGLGLSLVKKFVELHGGNISCESEVGKGTIFTFEIPLKFASGEEIAAEVKADNTKNLSEQLPKPITEQASEKVLDIPQIIKPPNSNNDEPLILIVEDDDASRELLETTLTHEGYCVATASNGKDALKLAEKIKPFAITLDIMMPGMNGWEVLKRLKLEERTNDIPVIITSMVDDKKLGIVWGVEECFTKPIPKDELLATLEKIKQKNAKKSLKVLVVDDEKSASELMAAMLDEKEFDVLKVYEGKEAIDVAFREKPEVIILDLMMPEISGFEVINALKSNPDTIDIPIIVCTAKDLDSNDIRELSKNISSILHKGMFTQEELLSCIKQIQKMEM